MTEFILDNEPAVRLGIFLAVLILVAAWEAFSPRRVRAFSRSFCLVLESPRRRESRRQSRLSACSSRTPLTLGI